MGEAPRGEECRLAVAGLGEVLLSSPPPRPSPPPRRRRMPPPPEEERPPPMPKPKRPPPKLPSVEVRQRQMEERLAVLTTEAARQELGDKLELILLRSEVVGLLRQINATKQLARRAWVVCAALAQSGLMRLRRCKEEAIRRR